MIRSARMAGLQKEGKYYYLFCKIDKKFFIWIRCNPLKSPNSTKGIQGNASFFAWISLDFLDSFAFILAAGAERIGAPASWPRSRGRDAPAMPPGHAPAQRTGRGRRGPLPQGRGLRRRARSPASPGTWSPGEALCPASRASWAWPSAFTSARSPSSAATSAVSPSREARTSATVRGRRGQSRR